MGRTLDKPDLLQAADDPLAEMWRIKDARAEDYGDDLRRFFAETRKRQRLSGHHVVKLKSRRTQAPSK